MRRTTLVLSFFMLASVAVFAQGKLEGLEYKIELQGSVSDGKTPLWLNANRHGLSSLEKSNGYARAVLIRPLGADTLRRWGIGYGVDVAVPYHYTSKMVVQQAFAELRWLSGVLSVGAKEYPMELKNNELSSGSQTLGINARPVPQVRLALPDYYTLPFWGGWLHLKGHIAYGKMTDQNWQHEFTQRKSKYADGTLLHTKAGFLKISNQDRFVPWSIELGLEMASLFGGNAYVPVSGGKLQQFKGDNSLKGLWHAFLPGGADAPEVGTEYQNAEGDVLGSWMMRFNYDSDTWRLGFYGEKFFEDHSMMLQVDYDGYGTGDEWAVKKKRRFFLYDLKDMLLGVELNLKYSEWVRDIVVEYLYSKYQSGPVYHDHTPGFKEHISGRDDYYNHYIYTGWQHWGQVMGNPLYRSPIYNTNGRIHIANNRSMAFHLGISGQPTEQLSYRLRTTYLEGFGTYDEPYSKKHHFIGFGLDLAYQLPHNWRVKGSYGMDFGHILGSNVGAQLTVTKTGLLSHLLRSPKRMNHNEKGKQ